MTPEERDRLVRLEARADAMEATLGKIDANVTSLLKAANMGKGAGWMLLKVGGLLVVLVGAGGWVWDRIHS